MRGSSVNILRFRGFVSCIGVVGNTALIIFILQTKGSHVKSFELFLLGLATANLEEIVAVNIYDVIPFRTSSPTAGTWWCGLLKCLSVSGEIASIFFTVIISIFRCLKLIDAKKRGSLPIYLDNVQYAWMLSGLCVALSALLSLSTLVVTMADSVENATEAFTTCPTDFFQCGRNNCPTQNLLFKCFFMLMCYLLPLSIVTVTSYLVIAVLLTQEHTVMPVDGVSGSNHHSEAHHRHRFHRSTISVVAAMGLFQVDWVIYIILQWTLNPADYPFWAEIEFFISISYTTISPYVYGIGNHLFSIKNFKSILLKL